MSMTGPGCEKCRHSGRVPFPGEPEGSSVRIPCPHCSPWSKEEARVGVRAAVVAYFAAQKALRAAVPKNVCCVRPQDRTGLRWALQEETPETGPLLLIEEPGYEIEGSTLTSRPGYGWRDEWAYRPRRQDAGDGMVFVPDHDPSFGVVYVFDACCEVTGAEAEELFRKRRKEIDVFDAEILGGIPEMETKP